MSNQRPQFPIYRPNEPRPQRPQPVVLTPQTNQQQPPQAHNNTPNVPQQIDARHPVDLKGILTEYISERYDDDFKLYTTHNIPGNPNNNAAYAARLQKNEIGVEDVYFLFDSFFKTSDSNIQQGLLTFDMMLLNNNNPLKNIIEIEVANFTIPQLDAPNNYQPNPFIAKRLYLDIEEIAATQYVHGPTKTPLEKHHFEFELTTQTDLPNRYFAKPALHSKFIATIPIYSLSQASIRLRIPYQNVPFQSDTFLSTTVPLTRRIQTSIPHNVSTPTTTIYIFGFASTNNDLNIFMNDPNGQIVNVISNNTLEFTLQPSIVDQLGTALTPSGQKPTFTIGLIDRRIAIEMRFRSIATHITNYISP